MGSSVGSVVIGRADRGLWHALKSEYSQREPKRGLRSEHDTALSVAWGRGRLMIREREPAWKGQNVT